jgi:SanA protein
MSASKNYKPGVPKRILLFIAGFMWTFAGSMLWFRGFKTVIECGFPVKWTLWIGFIGGLLFYLLLFARISLKHSKRIFAIPVDKPCAFSFFSIKGYIMMLLMISSGVLLRLSGSVDPVIIGVFYVIMGFPLLLSSLRFWYFGIRYKKFFQEFTDVEGSNIKALSRWQRRLRNFLSVSTVLLVLLVSYVNWQISHFSDPYIYSKIEDLPVNKVGLVPGTSSRMASGNSNMFFQYRLQAAAELYRSGKIKFVILSGDNGTSSYNEPAAMKKELIKLGVPDSAIFLDYAGFRTFDSVIRAWKVFGQKNFTFISQQFQNERAIFIARKNGIDAVAYNAKDVTTYSGFKTKSRELFARVKVYIDIYILNTQPRYLGDPIDIDDKTQNR